MEKNRKLNKGMEIKLAKTIIRKQVGGSLLTSLLTLAPTIGKPLGVSARAGLASEGASQIVKKISGKGQASGFLVPHSKIEQLIPHEHLLTNKQKKDIANALQTGSGVSIKPTKTQTGGFLGTLLASIGVPLAIEAIKKVTGGGAPRIGKAPVIMVELLQDLECIDHPHFTEHGEKVLGEKKRGKGLLLRKNSPFNGIPLVGAIL